MGKFPKVSIIIPLYNAEKYIAETIESVLNQTYQNFEVIIVDDSGQDNSINIVGQYKDSRIKVIHNPQNRGIAYSRNIGLANATGEFISLLDDDDIAISTRLEKQISYLQDNPEIGVVGGNAQWIDERGNLVRDVIEVIEDPETIKMFLHFRNLFNNSEMTFRANVIRENGIEYSDKCYGMEDFLFWVKLSKVVKFANIPDLVLKKRVVHTNETAHMLKKKGKERKEKYFEIQAYSLSRSGFILNQDDGRALRKFFDEKAGVCKSFGDIELLKGFMSRIITQARDMGVSFCEPLENWFSELLEWNILNFKNSYLEDWRESVKQFQNVEIMRVPISKKGFTTDLVKLKEIGMRYEEQEKYVQELLEAKEWLEKRYEEQEGYVQELLKAKEWLEGQHREQGEYVQELLKAKEWLEEQHREQGEYVQELLKAKEWLEGQHEEQEKYIQELLSGKEWLEEHSREQELYIKDLLNKVSNSFRKKDRGLTKRMDRQKYNENGFDHIISLGYNCEVSFRIKDYIGKDIDSYPLSWSYMIDQSKISSIIDHLEDMFTGESTVNIESGMIKCEKLNVSWHTKIDHTNLSEENKERYKDSALLEMKERHSYLRKKFNNLFNSNDSTLFIIKCQEWNEYSEIARYLGELEQKLDEKYLSGKYFLLAVTDDKELYDILVRESNAVRGCTLIAQFAEDSNTQQGGDIDGWMEAIHYYNHLKDINYNSMNYIVSTVEHRHQL